MKNVLLWIASIFSMLLDAVKKSKLDIVTIQVPRYEFGELKISIELKGEKEMLIITSSIKNVRAFKQVQTYADAHGLRVIGAYIEKGKRHFVLSKVED